MRATRESGSIPPTHVWFPYDGVSGQRHALAALYPRGNDPLYPLDRRLGGPQSWSGQRLEEKREVCVRVVNTLFHSIKTELP
jgi:hypothetical protein